MKKGEYSSITKSVVTPKGNWRKFKHLRIPDYFHNLSDATKYNLIRNTLIIGNYIFRQHIDDLAFKIITVYGEIDLSDRNHFRSGHIGYVLNQNINYCEQCIEDSIRTFGVGYFKKHWMLPNSSYCDIHNLKLDTIKFKKGLSIYNQIISIMQANFPKKITKVDSNNRLKIIPFNKAKSYLSISEDCLWNEVVLFIQLSLKSIFKTYDLNFINYEYQQMYRLITTSFNWSGELYLVELMAKNFTLELNNFLSKNAKIIKSQRVLPDGSIINYKSAKLNNSKCDFCLLTPKECINSLNIECTDIEHNNSMRWPSSRKVFG
jgi:hypothetical protein